MVNICNIRIRFVSTFYLHMQIIEWNRNVNICKWIHSIRVGDVVNTLIPLKLNNTYININNPLGYKSYSIPKIVTQINVESLNAWNLYTAISLEHWIFMFWIHLNWCRNWKICPEFVRDMSTLTWISDGGCVLIQASIVNIPAIFGECIYDCTNVSIFQS